MIGIKLKIFDNKVINFQFFNNGNRVIKFNYKNFKIVIIGQIFENKNEIFKKIQSSLDKKKLRNLLKLNGEYVLTALNKKDKIYIIGNSQNSYIPVFYVNSKNNLSVDQNILNFNSKDYSQLNLKKMYEWLIFNGRSFNNETFLTKIKILEAGSLIIKNKKNLRNYLLPPFIYKPNKMTLNDATRMASNSLKKAINDRIKNSKGNTQLGLSGGLDSRILASLVEKNNLSKVTSHTISSKFSFEKKISSIVANNLKLNHFQINVPVKDYYLYAFEAIKFGGFNNVFKHGIYRKFLKRKFKDKDKYNIMFGNALDVLIASSYSSRDLKKIRSKKKYINWFKNKYQLFSLKEINLIFNDKKIDNKYLYKNFYNSLNKYNFNKNNSIDINDAFTFETRIKRWHNYTLSSYSEFINFLIPTYDQNFLKICSSIPSNLRLRDLLRKNILKKINSKLYNLKTSNFLEKTNAKKRAKFKNFYDVNLGFDMKKNNHILKLFYKIKKELALLDKDKFLNINLIEKSILEHKFQDKDISRRIILMISFLISMILIFRKQKFKNEKN